MDRPMRGYRSPRGLMGARLSSPCLDGRFDTQRHQTPGLKSQMQMYRWREGWREGRREGWRERGRGVEGESAIERDRDKMEIDKD